MEIKPGDKFGHWTIIKFDEEHEKERLEKAKITKKYGSKKWICQCDCKNKTIRSVREGDLKNGKSASCGCDKKGIIKFNKETKAKINKYDLSGEYGIGWTSNTNKEFYFDLEDYDKIKQYCWREGQWGYCMTTTKEDNKGKFIQHILLNTNKTIDHKNRNKMDNRKENLRVCTMQENRINASIPNSNTSGFIGVGFDRRYNKYIARIKINRKQIYLGSYSTIQEAVKVRLKAEKEYFGDFAPQRHLFKEYNII